MVLETVNSAIHCALPEKLSKAPLDHKFPNHRKQVNRAADSCDYQPNRKKTTGRAERLYLAEPHRRDGNDGHVEGVENRQVLDQPVAGCADYGHRRDQRDCERESASWGHRAAVRGDLCERAMSREIPPRITCHTPNWNVSGTPRLINSDCGRQASIRGRTNLIECETRGGFHTSFGRGWTLPPNKRKNAGLRPC